MGKQLRLVGEQVNFIDYQHSRKSRLLDLLKHDAVFLRPCRPIHDENHQVDIANSSTGRPVHVAVNGFTRILVQARCIDKYNLMIILRLNP